MYRERESFIRSYPYRQRLILSAVLQRSSFICVKLFQSIGLICICTCEFADFTFCTSVAGSPSLPLLLAEETSNGRDCGTKRPPTTTLLTLLQPPSSFGFPNERNQGKQARPVLKYWVPHGSQPRPGWAPDPLMVGIRSPIGLVVGSCTSHPEVWIFTPATLNQGKQAHPVLKYRVPHGSHVIGTAAINTHTWCR